VAATKKYVIPKNARLLSRAEVLRMVPVTYATLWAWQQTGKFPRSVNLGGGADHRKIGFYEHEVLAWLRSRERVRLKADKAAKQEAPLARGQVGFDNVEGPS
jgi:predicted DNA-binding transcriptional regulator AlpA